MNYIRNILLVAFVLFLCCPANAALLLTSGETLANGDLIKLDGSGQAVKTTAVTDHVIGVARGGAPVGESVVVDTDGKVTLKCGSGVAIGEYLSPSATAGTADDGRSVFGTYAFAVAITAHSGGTCTAILQSSVGKTSSGTADPSALSSGSGYIDTDGPDGSGAATSVLYFENGTDARDVSDKRFETFLSAQSVTEGATRVSLDLPNNWTEIWITEFTCTPTGGGSDVDVTLYDQATGGTTIESWQNWDASAATLTDKGGVYYRNAEGNDDLVITVDAQTGGPGTYTVTVRGFGLARKPL